MAILTVNFQENEQMALTWIVETMREMLEREQLRLPDRGEGSLQLLREFNEATRAWNKSFLPRDIEPGMIETVEQSDNVFGYEETDHFQAELAEPPIRVRDLEI